MSPAEKTCPLPSLCRSLPFLWKQRFTADALVWEIIFGHEGVLEDAGERIESSEIAEYPHRNDSAGNALNRPTVRIRLDITQQLIKELCCHGYIRRRTENKISEHVRQIVIFLLKCPAVQDIRLKGS